MADPHPIGQADVVPPVARTAVNAPLGGKVLVIDDSEIARAELVRVLGDAGMDVVSIPSPIGATRAIVEYGVVVVVIDVVMPSIRGERLAALLRANTRFKSLGVVLVTGERGHEIERLALEADADAIVSKKLLHELAPAVRRARATRSRANAGT